MQMQIPVMSLQGRDTRLSASQHRKPDKQKEQATNVILEVDEEERTKESPAWKAANEERAALYLEHTQFLNEKAEDEYQHQGKENDMKREDDHLKQTRKDLHEMHKANVRCQTELDRRLKELKEQEVQKEVEELRRQAQEVDLS